MSVAENNYTIFKEKAKEVSAFVKEFKTIEEALESTVDICLKNNSHKKVKNIAAVLKDTIILDQLKKIADENSIHILTKNLKQYSSGIDIGLTFAEYGIAETGTVVINSDSYDLRLSTMISDIHIVLLKKSNIVNTAESIEDKLSQCMNNKSGYLAFITGASRTADIERVLAIGVHGPLELYIFVLEDV